jgi:sialic acid synthase SpsE
MITINNREIGEGNPIYIVAEMGINHNGSLDIALKMVEEAAKSGVDAVKIQIVDADRNYAKNSMSYTIFKKVELEIDKWRKVVELAKNLNLDIFSTFAHPGDLVIAEELEFPVIKISSSNLTNFPLLKAAAVTGKPILLSTGMSYINEIDEAIRYIEQNGNDRIGILQCTALYPTPPKDVNLLAIETLRKVFSYTVGFSDHTKGICSAIASVALGAKIIEKHFTLDRSMEGSDHCFSSTPEELMQMVRSIREVELSMGSSIKRPVSDEISFRDKLRRSIVAARNIEKGETLTEDKITAKRSNVKGLEPRYIEIIVGREVKKNISKDDPITMDLL